MKLVIAEKPSVSMAISRVIGATKRQDGYLEGNGYLVSWCVGHLVELSAPERYDVRFAKWRLIEKKEPMAVMIAGKTAYKTKFRSRIPSDRNRRRLENCAISGFSRSPYTDTLCIKDNVLLER